MRHTDIAIIGGGLAGSTAAAMLGRAGIPNILIDPHWTYPFDFRVEKLGGVEQLQRFAATGFAESVLRSATRSGENWIARFGYLLDTPPNQQFGIMYAALIAAIRAEIAEPAEFVCDKVIDVRTSAERQTLALSNGDTISARLVVLANGLNVGLRRSLGIGREVTSPCHSISFGFDLVPVGRSAFPFAAMTYFSERPSDRIPYLTLFPIEGRMRANLFTYRQADDPWLRAMRRNPVEALNAALPRLRRITGDFDVSGDIRVRPTDLYVSTGYRQAGVVLVGDAFAATCPVSGTGTDKVFTDVVQLCSVHIPAWLATDGMGADKIATYYDDPLKTACDAWSNAKAFSFRSVSIDPGLYWRAQRWARFLAYLVKGRLRRLRSGGRRAAVAHAVPQTPQ
ncbi:NAD(P)/FAD-dependent oxidoreductase [Bradyrhizobium sp. ISRA464]|uniref:FAD-dependent oxidoreductase n=1 Tax=Bradyrhizobium sp. ISRA464 TaxID=2866200 RepID=UPI00247AF9E8|nr:NAD(P)/FAD-dependent oxidoreductase [Bradyrhizobium sp. ISRA464]WGS30411.1 FAD-dependent monooxygenase [Bradyrhizobium sp. ISRA464]